VGNLKTIFIWHLKCHCPSTAAFIHNQLETQYYYGSHLGFFLPTVLWVQFGEIDTLKERND